MKHHTHQSLAWILTGLLSLGFAQWGCTPKVNYPVQNETSQPQENGDNSQEQNQTPAVPQNTAATDSMAPAFISEELQNKEEQEVAPFIETYSVDAHVSGTMVQVVTEMTIRNPNRRPFSGTLEFPIPDGAILNGYAIDIDSLDIHHQMVDAVVADKHIAREAFEAEVKRGVDPGLLEAVRGNTFRTRIYPIMGHGYRRIRMTYTMPLTVDTNGAAALSLPMIKSELRERKIHITVDMPEHLKPILSGLGDTQFEDAQSVWVLDKTDHLITPQEDLLISMPVLPDVITTTESDAKYPDEKYFRIDIKTGNTSGATKPEDMSNLRLIWDASMSRKPDDIQLARKVLAQIPQNGNYELHVLRNLLEQPRVFHTRDELLHYIDQIQYDGGTNFTELLELAKTSFAGKTLFFTDGIDTYFGDVPEFGPHSAAVISGQMYDINVLKHACGGQALNLKTLTPDEVYQSIVKPLPRIASVKGTQISEVQGIGNPAVGRATVIGKWNGKEDTVKITLSDGRKFSVNIDSKNIQSSRMIATSWAASKVQELAPFPEANRDELLALGKKYNMVSPITSMIVFESYDQWVRYDIEPPESLTEIHKKWIEQHNQKLERIAKDKAAAEEKHQAWIKDIQELWQKRIEWWEYPKPQKIKRKYYCPNNDMQKCKETVSSELGWHYTVAFTPPKGWKCNEANHCTTEQPSIGYGFGGGGFGAGGGGAGLGSIGRPNSTSGQITQDFDIVEAKIEIKEWDPNTPYLKKLKEIRKNGGDNEALYAEYLRQRQEYETNSAFYFDVANYFFQENIRDYAIRILSNLTELRIDDPALLRVLAWRLRDADALDDAILMARKCIELSPNDNHLWHELALLLELRAKKNSNPDDAQESLECYKKAAFELHSSWYGHSNRSIALVSIEEFNVLAGWIERQNWPNKKPIIPDIDKQFKKLLDTDLRIIMSWDIDNTDIDLHITEPTTEIIYYGHKRSVEGGLLSADITDGFGPEEYLIKKALKGKYKISTNYYASHEENLIGAVTITTTVFKNWGRPNQSQQSIVYRLETPDHNRSNLEQQAQCDDNDDNCSEDSTIRIGTITVE